MCDGGDYYVVNKIVRKIISILPCSVPNISSMHWFLFQVSWFPKRPRPRKNHPPRDVSQYGERVEAPFPSEDSYPYELIFVKDTSATTCYGCKGKVREKPSAPPPPPPYDLFIRHFERRVYNRPGETKLRISTKPEMVYFHPFKSCVNLTVQDAKDGRLLAKDDIEQCLNQAHKRLLLKEFGMVFPSK